MVLSIIGIIIKEGGKRLCRTATIVLG